MNQPPPMESHLMLAYSFTGPRPNEKFWAVVAVYADETFASLAVQRQVTRTSVGPSQREDSTHMIWCCGKQMTSCLARFSCAALTL